MLLTILILFLSLSTQETPGEHRLDVVRSNTHETVVRLFVPLPGWEEKSLDGVSYQAVQLEGAVPAVEAGEPELPVYRFALALPPGTIPSIGITTDRRVSFRDVSVPPVPRRVLMPRRRGGGIEPVEIIGKPKAVAEPYPRVRAKVIQTGRIRSLDVAYIEVSPFEYFPSQKLLCLDRDITVTITVEQNPFAQLLPRKRPEERDPMEPVLSKLLINYDSAKAWRQGPLEVSLETLDPWDPPEGSYKLLLGHRGFYSVTGRELRDAGIYLPDIDPSTLRLLVGGEEVPIHLLGTDDGAFGLDDRLEFVGYPVYREDPGNRFLPVGGRFTETNVYWLVWGGEDGLRIGERQVQGSGIGEDASYFRRSIHIEEDLNPFVPSEGAISGDRYGEEWFWGPPLTPGDGKVDYAFTIQGVAPVLDPIHMRVSLRGYTHPHLNHDPHHHAIVYLNDVQLTHLLWYANDEAFYNSLDDPFYDPGPWPNSGAIYSGSNRFSVEITGDTEYEWFDGAYTDWFEIDYWKTYEVWNDSLAFSSPQQEGPGTYRYSVSGFSDSDLVLLDLTHMEILTGFETEFVPADDRWSLRFVDDTEDSTLYLALTESTKETVTSIIEEIPSDLHGSVGSELVVISHEYFLDQASRLAEGRTFRDTLISGVVVDVQDIYDEYSYGIFDPRAIRDFLTDGYINWPIAPAFVTLLGDASWDYKLNSPTSDPAHLNFVPSYGNPAMDDYFANVDDQGGLDSLLPDLYIARIPVENADTARAVVDKILAYENGLFDPGDWRENVLCISGGYEDANGNDTRGYFEGQCRNLIDDWVLPEPAHYNGILFARPESLHFENEYETTEDESLQVLFNEIGTVHATYIGHGASWTWETMFWASDVENDLNNSGMLPMVNSMTCHTARFANPEIDSFGEIWLWQPHGAMGFWGTTAWGHTTPDYIMARKQFEILFRDQERIPMVALLLSKLDPSLANYIDDPMISPLLYVWLGDPLVSLALANRPDWVMDEDDIQVTPQPVISGDTVAVRINIRNMGIDPGPSTLLRLFDADPDTGGSVLTELAVPALAKGDSIYIEWEQVIIGDPGDREVFAWVNPDTANQEAYRGNNRSSITFSVESPIPDLAIYDSTLSVLPQSPQVLDSILTVSLIITNQGTGPAAAFRVLLVDSSLSSGAVRELADIELPGLERGGDVSVDTVWIIADTDAGDHIVTASVDSRDEVEEMDEGNNIASTSLHIATRAELEAVELVFSNDRPPEGDSLRFTGSWENIGESDASDFRVAILHGHPDSSDTYVVGEKTVGSLAGGESDSLSCDWSTVGQVGAHTFYLVVDIDRNVSEMDETNNVLTNQVDVVTGPDLCIELVELFPLNPVEGDSSRVRLAVRNGGMVDADSFDVVMTIDDLTLAQWRIHLGGQSELSLEHRWLWERGASSGDHTLVVEVDSDGEVEETNEENNEAELNVYVLTLADLEVDLTPGSNTAVEGEIIRLYASISNKGEAQAHTIRLLWFMRFSEATEWAAIDSVFIPVLEGGEERSESTEVIPVPGLIEFSATVHTSVEEQTEENNQDFCSVAVREKYPPDLVLLSFDLSADTVTVGENARAEVKVFNLGEIVPDSTWLELRRVPEDSLMGVWAISLPGADDTVSVALFWPVEHGESILKVTAFSIPDDTLSANNVLIDTLIGLWPADLEAVDGQIEATPVRPLAGDTVSVELRVRNSGERTAELYSVALFRGDPSPGQSDIAELLNTVTPEEGLEPGQTREIELKFAAPDEPGREEFYVWIDAAQLVEETNETNNLLGVWIEVLSPDFTMMPVYPVPSPANGRTRFLVQVSHEAEVELRIYSVAGRLVDVIGPRDVVPERYEGIEWLCTDRDGDKVANGVYLYRVDAVSARNGEKKSFRGKIVVRR